MHIIEVSLTLANYFLSTCSSFKKHLKTHQTEGSAYLAIVSLPNTLVQFQIEELLESITDIITQYNPTKNPSYWLEERAAAASSAYANTTVTATSAATASASTSISSNSEAMYTLETLSDIPEEPPNFLTTLSSDMLLEEPTSVTGYEPSESPSSEHSYFPK